MADPPPRQFECSTISPPSSRWKDVILTRFVTRGNTGNLPLKGCMRPRDFIVAFIAVLAVAGPRAATGASLLSPVADVPLSGGATRFDYQSFDPRTNRLYLSHMGEGELVVFDTQARRVVASLGGFPTVTGALVVPELHRVFASAAGSHEVVIVDTETLKTLARVPAGEFPDGLAYAADAHKVYVSDEGEGKETVIDVETNRRVATIDVGGEAVRFRIAPDSGQRADAKPAGRHRSEDGRGHRASRSGGREVTPRPVHRGRGAPGLHRM